MQVHRVHPFAFYLTVCNEFTNIKVSDIPVITDAVKVKWVMLTFEQTRDQASPFAIPSVNFSNNSDLI